jgi:hypothetical protein
MASAVGAPKSPIQNRFALIRNYFTDYLARQDERLLSELNMDLLSPATKEPIRFGLPVREGGTPRSGRAKADRHKRGM